MTFEELVQGMINDMDADAKGVDHITWAKLFYNLALETAAENATLKCSEATISLSEQAYFDNEAERLVEIDKQSILDLKIK